MIRFRKKRIWMSLLCGIFFTAFWFYLLPDKWFDVGYSTILYDQDGRLLSGKIASDQQWRFPKSDSIPQKVKTCILNFEDRWFYYHPGVRLESFGRALFQNLKSGKVVSGGSTITMQVIRLNRQNPSRTFTEKILEVFRAVQLEVIRSKEEILNLYVSHAPFGGNVVGLEAASWRYFNKNAHLLSWAEAATIAVLPNAPGLIHPGKNRIELKEKRDRLLKLLLDRGVISELEFDLSLIETIPDKPYSIPQQATHLMTTAEKHGHQQEIIQTSINQSLQDEVSQTIGRHHQRLSGNHIQNMAVLVADLHSGKVMSYQGNYLTSNESAESYNDMIFTPRSSGSILKPFLFAHALDGSVITPQTLVADIPTEYDGFVPQNYNLGYEGALPASRALARSLNVPIVRLLRDYGLEKFYLDLQDWDFTTINRSADVYGLTLILGGAEVTLWDLVSNYRKMALKVALPDSVESIPALSYLQTDSSKTETAPVTAGASWATMQALLEVARPEELQMWDYFNSGKPIAWKTGTSFGFRDAWAVGFSSGYVVGVWVGNASGEGRPGITGIDAAAPLLFDIFQKLPASPWFEEPVYSLQQTALCSRSGMLVSPNCADTVLELLPEASSKTSVCDRCNTVWIDNKTNLRANLSCESGSGITPKKWFSLPPVMEWYFKKKHPEYHSLPEWNQGCAERVFEKELAIIYPKHTSKITLPVDFDEKQTSMVLEASSKLEDEILYWHVDDQFMGTTQHFHQLKVQLKPGEHTLTVLNTKGNSVSAIFDVVSTP